MSKATHCRKHGLPLKARLSGKKYCPKCHSERGSRTSHEYNLRRNYGLSLEEYDALVKKQNGLCAICGDRAEKLNHDRFTRLLSVDHDHVSGKVRGLLCNNCNNGLGRFKDDPALLLAAIGYLIDSHPEKAFISNAGKSVCVYPNKPYTSCPITPHVPPPCSSLS